jgi:ABC-type Fe3+ transport system permease subunit
VVLGSGAGVTVAFLPYLAGSARLVAGIGATVLILLNLVIGFFLTRSRARLHQWSNQTLVLVYALQAAAVAVGGVVCVAYVFHDIGLAGLSLVLALILFGASEAIWRLQPRSQERAHS